MPPKTMPAIICRAPEDYRLEEHPVPTAGPGEVLVRVESVGICASDLKCYLGAPLFWGDAHREGYCQAPIIPGHEFVGEVVELGEGAGEKYGLSVGDKTVSEQIVPCGECRYCRRGQYWMCAVHDIYGFRQATFGAMAEYMKFPAKALNYKVPDDLPSHHAAYVEPLACTIHGTHLSPDCYPVAIRMLDKGLPPMDRIVTHQLPLPTSKRASTSSPPARNRSKSP